MSDKLEKALKRLQSILPLKESQEKCSPQVKQLHQQVLRSFITRGRILSKEEMAQHVSHLDEAVDVLRKSDMVTFSENSEPVGAYPFTMNEREYKIQVNGHQVYAMCALDALAVGPMFGETTQITSQCRVTGKPVNIRMSGQKIQNPGEVGDIHFGIIWGAADEKSCCADSLCMQMIFLQDSETAEQWLADNSGNKEVFTLQEAVKFSGRFFTPLLS